MLGNGAKRGMGKSAAGCGIKKGLGMTSDIRAVCLVGISRRKAEVTGGFCV